MRRISGVSLKHEKTLLSPEVRKTPFKVALGRELPAPEPPRSVRCPAAAGPILMEMRSPAVPRGGGRGSQAAWPGCRQRGGGGSAASSTAAPRRGLGTNPRSPWCPASPRPCLCPRESPLEAVWVLGSRTPRPVQRIPVAPWHRICPTTVSAAGAA